MKTVVIAQNGRGISSQSATEYASIAAAKVFNAKTRAACRTRKEDVRFMAMGRFFQSGEALRVHLSRPFRNCGVVGKIGNHPSKNWNEGLSRGSLTGRPTRASARSRPAARSRRDRFDAGPTHHEVANRAKHRSEWRAGKSPSTSRRRQSAVSKVATAPPW